MKQKISDKIEIPYLQSLWNAFASKFLKVKQFL